jgi:bifunctional non-homologous end joining protein LigD
LYFALKIVSTPVRCASRNRMLAHHDGARVRLISGRRLDWASRFPTIVAAIEALAVRTCIIDGELIACDANGLAELRWRKRDGPAIYWASTSSSSTAAISGASRSRRARSELARLLAGCQPLALVPNRVYDDPGQVVFEHACKLGCEGKVSKRRGSRYARGLSSSWLKVKNPDAPAVQRERTEAWGR